jgi:adenosylmethionine-8-amino-7-oxononanoate aminotransferase
MKAFASIERLVTEHHGEVAAVILEPLCQGAGGIRIYPAEYLRQVRALCDKHDILLIADEIAVGFGRTGTFWACEQGEVVPDILCVGKALTGGYLPMSAAIASTEVFDSFRGDGVEKRPFWDGHTYCGNPITSAVALAALDVFAEEDYPTSCAGLTAQMRVGMAEIGLDGRIAYQKTVGLIGMVSFSEEAGGAVLSRKVSLRAMDLGLFVRPLGEVLYLWPPMTSTGEELGEMLSILGEAVRSTGA